MDKGWNRYGSWEDQSLTGTAPSKLFILGMRDLTLGHDSTPRRISSTGPTPCPIALIGEAGGVTEDKKGKAFAGKAGTVLNTYLQAVSLKRYSDVFVDNIYPYWTGPGNPPPTPEQIKDHEHLLKRTLERVKPKVLGCLGDTAARWFLGPEVEMHSWHGLVFEKEMSWGKVLIVPCFHPAAGFYDPSASGRCQDDLRIVRDARNGKVEVWKELDLPKSELLPFPHPLSGHVQMWEGDAADTEGSVVYPWGLSWAHEGMETGRIYSYVSKYQPHLPLVLPKHLIFHFSLHDLKVFRGMGADTSTLDYDDTMVMAFNLGGLEPQGLKELAFRLLHVRMDDYEGIVRKYYNAKVADWVNDLLDRGLPEKGIEVLVKEKGKYRIKGVRAPRSRFAAIMLDAIQGGEPEKKWKDLPKEYREIAVDRMGEKFPRFSSGLELVPIKKAVQYAGADAWATKRLFPILKKRLEEKGTWNVYQIDRDSLPYLDMMQENGLPVDVEAAKELSQELEEKLGDIEREMCGIVGRRFNPGSRDQVAEILFREFDLYAPRMTPEDQESTDKKSIQILRGRETREEVISFLDHLIEYRETQKNKGTYVDTIVETAVETDDGWRVFSNLKNTRVASGRLSSGRMPKGDKTLNVLAMPTRTLEGKRIRKLFVAREGWNILSVDNSQVELRFVAELSRDKRMMQAFRGKEDLHALTTSLIFKIALEKIKKESPQRFIGKTLNFAILFGISAKALLENLYANGIYTYTLRDCEKFIAAWFAAYPGILVFLEKLWKESEESGEVRDWCGRMRYVPNIRLPKGPLKEAAKRETANHPIQSGAHELVKFAEIELIPFMRENRGDVRPILQIHDELLLEVRRERVEEIGEVVRKAMVGKGSKTFKVPFEAGVAWADSWGTLPK